MAARCSAIGLLNKAQPSSSRKWPTHERSAAQGFGFSGRLSKFIALVPRVLDTLESG